ncbi:MAG: hypothetical protein ABIT07_09810 [Ferruginibacter sp.]
MKTLIILFYAVVFGCPNVIFKTKNATAKHSCERHVTGSSRVINEKGPQKKTASISSYDNIYYKIQ